MVFKHILFTKYIAEINLLKSKDDEMSRVCGRYGSEEKCTGFWWGNLKGRDHL